jgi:methionyl-tRNA synthetase
MVAKMHPEKASAPASDQAADAGQAAGNGSGPDAAKNDVSEPEPKPEISIDDFAKLQIQVGEVIQCEEVKKSRKLLCSQVKIGSGTRQILSGIKQWYTPEEMIGKKVLVITNLKSAKLAGMVSEGMILCAEDAQGRLSLVNPEREVDCGAQIR